jgi:hypothetical protein
MTLTSTFLLHGLYMPFNFLLSSLLKVSHGTHQHPSNDLETGCEKQPTNFSSLVQDCVVPPRLGQQYTEAAKMVGDDVTFVSVESTAHFELITPGSAAWNQVVEAVISILNLKN